MPGTICDLSEAFNWIKFLVQKATAFEWKKSLISSQPSLVADIMLYLTRYQLHCGEMWNIFIRVRCRAAVPGPVERLNFRATAMASIHDRKHDRKWFMSAVHFKISPISRQPPHVESFLFVKTSINKIHSSWTSGTRQQALNNETDLDGLWQAKYWPSLHLASDWILTRETLDREQIGCRRGSKQNDGQCIRGVGVRVKR